MSDLEDDDTSRLERMPEWQQMSELQRQMILLHHQEPELSRNSIAKKIGCQPTTVYRFFESPRFERVNDFLAKQAMKELKQLALKTVKDVLLNSSSEKTRADVALKILQSEDVLKKAPTVVKQDNRIQVAWQGAKAPPISLPEPVTNEHRDTVPSASQAIGDPL